MGPALALWDDRRGLAEQARELALQLRDVAARLQAITPPANGSGDFLKLKNRLVSTGQARAIQAKKLRDDINKGSGADQYGRVAELRAGVRAFAADCLALQQSLTLRSQSPAREVCAAADGLLEEYSTAVQRQRSHYALVSEAEHFGPQSAAVHLGFAGLSFWSLGKTAHEFGHLWAAEDPTCGDIQDDFLAGHSADWSESHRRELFADIIGTYVLGPAFAYSTLLLDLNPAAGQVSETHPTGDQRAHCILFGLEATFENHDPQPRSSVKTAHRELGQYWARARTAGGWQAAPNKVDDLQYAVDKAMGALWNRAPQAMYTGISQAHGVQNEITKVAGPVAAIRWRDIVNGAWFARYQAPQESIEIGAAALRMGARVGGN